MLSAPVRYEHVGVGVSRNSRGTSPENGTLVGRPTIR